MEADTVRIDKEAFIALEGSEQYHYTLAGTFERLWIEKRKECDLLNEQLKAALENESLNAESIRLLRGQIAQLQKEIAELEERIKDAQRKNKRARVWGNVKAGVAFSFGVFVGVKVVR